MQAINGTIPDVEITMFRYMGLLIISLVSLKTTRTALYVDVGLYFHVTLTSLISGGFCFSYYASMNYLPLSHVSAAFMSLKIIFMAVLARILKGELRKSILIATVGSIAGILLIVQPWKEFQNRLVTEHNSTDDATHHSNLTEFPFNTIKNQWTSEIDNTLFGYFLVFLAAIFDTFFLTSVGVYLKNIHPMIICFLTACICIITSGISCFYVGQPVIIIEQSTIFLVCLHVIFSSLAVIMQIISCQLIDPVNVAIVENLETVTFLIPQYLFMKNGFYGHMNLMEIGGCCLIVAMCAGAALLSQDGSHEDLP